MVEEQQFNPSRTEEITSYGVGNNQTAEQVKYLLSHDDIIMRYEMFLRGQDFNDDGIPETSSTAEPMANERGVRAILSELHLRISRVFTNSFYEEEELIRNITKQAGKDMVMKLETNSEEYGIKEENIGSIVHAFTDSVFAGLQKAKLGRQMNFLKDTTKMTEVRRVGGDGIFSKMTNVLK